MGFLLAGEINLDLPARTSNQMNIEKRGPI